MATSRLALRCNLQTEGEKEGETKSSLETDGKGGADKCGRGRPQSLSCNLERHHSKLLSVQNLFPHSGATVLEPRKPVTPAAKTPESYRSRLERPAKALGPMEEILLWLM